MIRSVLMQIPEGIPSKNLEKVLEYFHKKYSDIHPKERHPYDKVCDGYKLVPGYYLMLSESMIRAIVVPSQCLNANDIVIRYPLKHIIIGEL